TPFLFFKPPEKNTLYLSPPSLSGSCVEKDPSLSQHVSDTPIIPTSILLISLKTFASLPGLYKLLTFCAPILPSLLQPLNDDEGAPALPRPPHRAIPCASIGTKPFLPFTFTFLVFPLMAYPQRLFYALGP